MVGVLVIQPVPQQPPIALISPTAPTTTTYAGWDTGAWDFGTNEQFPALKYATDCINREITTDKSDIGQPICEEQLPNQQVELQNQFLPPCTNALALIDDYLTDNDEVPQRLDVDKDDNGLIEICDLEGLFEMRYQLDGVGYKTTDNETVMSNNRLVVALLPPLVALVLS